MSKNLTRKGLAFGAMVALSATSFVALPAAADTTGPVTLEPNAGETFNSLQQTGITLQSELDSTAVGVEEAGSLAFLVENPDAADLSIELNTLGTLDKQLDYESDTSPAVTAISPALNNNQRLTVEADNGTTPSVEDGDTDSTKKFIYVTGYTTASTSSFSDARFTKEIQTSAGITFNDNDDFVLTLPNGLTLTSTDAAGDNTPDIDSVVAAFRSDPNYDTSYAVVSKSGTDKVVVTFQAVGVNYSQSTLSENGAAAVALTTTANTPEKALSGFNFGTINAANELVIRVNTYTRENVTLYVRAWLDADGDGRVDTFEKSSDREKVTLFAVQNVSATTTLNNDLLLNPADKLIADIVLSNDINMEQVGSSIGAVFYKNGLPISISAGNSAAADSEVPIDASANGAGADIKSASWNSSLELLRATAYNWVIAGSGPNGNTPALGVGNYAAIAVYIGSNTTTDTDRFLGATSPIVSLNNGLVTGVVGAYVKGVSTVDVKYVDGNASTADTFDVRAATKTVTFTVQVTKRDTSNTDADGDVLDDDLKAANVEVRADFSASRLATGASVTVSGQADGTLKFTGDLVTSRARTNSDGIATFTITSLNGANLDAIAVDVQALNESGVWVKESSDTAPEDDRATITWKSTAVGAFAATNSAVSGDTVDLSFDVTDNFDQPVSTTTQGALKVYMVAVVNGAESPSTFSRTVDVVAGNAKASVANFVTKGTPALVVRGYLYRSGYETATANALLSGQALKTITVYNHAEVSAVQVPATLNALVTYSDYRTGNSNISSAVLKDSDLVAANGTRTDAVVLNGFVANANGAGLAASQVVVSGTGLLFESAGIFAKDSITVYAATDGTYSINVWTQTANATGVAITSTSGGKSATTTLKSYLPAALNGDNLVFTWSLPSTIVKNTTYVVTAKLADKWGNPVSTRTTSGGVAGVSFTGAGSVQVNGVNTAVAANFDATGTATVFVRSVRDVAGPGSISAALGNANYIATSTGTAAGTLTTSLVTTNKTTTVWDETKFVNSLSQVVDIKDVAPVTGKVNVGSFNGKLVVYASGLNGARISWKVGGNWGSAVATSNYSIFNRPTPRAGATVSVEVFVNGVKQLTKSVVTR